MSTKILYIEDNPDNRMLVRRVLQVEGYTVIEAPDGPTGIRIATEQIPDLILMDINLPDVDGYEITARIKQLPGLAKVPVIALTANVMKGDREKCLEAGASEYLAKPVTTEQLLSALRMWLHR